MKIGANRDTIMSCEDAGDEAGMMRCYFHVRARSHVCDALASETREKLHKFLQEKADLPHGGEEASRGGTGEASCSEKEAGHVMQRTPPFFHWRNRCDRGMCALGHPMSLLCRWLTP